MSESDIDKCYSISIALDIKCQVANALLRNTECIVMKQSSNCEFMLTGCRTEVLEDVN